MKITRVKKFSSPKLEQKVNGWIAQNPTKEVSKITFLNSPGGGNVAFVEYVDNRAKGRSIRRRQQMLISHRREGIGP